MNTNILSNITKTVSRTFSKSGLKLKKHSPEILVVTGVVGVVASTVMACKASTKVNDILTDTKEQVYHVHDTVAKVESGEVMKCRDGSNYAVEDGKKDLAIIYTQTAVKLVKLYAPAVILGALSITSILASNNILRKRNVALAAAYATVDKSFKEYRGRVVERFGEAMDKELRYNIRAKEIEEVTVDEKGKEHTSKKVVNVVDSNLGCSEYAKFFDEYCNGWCKDPEANLMFLRRQQDYANDALKRRGYLFLNDVYEMLGIQHTKAGQCVGWIYDEEHPVGDNYVDFGIYDAYCANDNIADGKRAFVNGLERSILLDFNVDGNILDMI